MKFYDLTCVDSDARANELKAGQWVTRADAEQAAQDAVEMARRLQQEITRWWSFDLGKVEDSSGYQLAQSIIDRYAGGE